MAEFEQKSQNTETNSAFDEYIEQLEEEKPHVSSKVEQDLIDYSKNKGKYARRSDPKPNRTSSGITAALIIGGVVTAITLAAGTVLFMADRTIDEQDYDEPYYQEDMEYEEPYLLLGDDIAKPELVLDDHYFQLPVAYKEFMQEDWQVHRKMSEEEVTEVGTEPVVLEIENEYGSVICDVTLMSPNGETVPVEDALVTGVFTNQEYRIQLPGVEYFSDYTIKEALENSSTDDWYMNSSGYHIKAEVDDERFSDYTVTIDMEDSYTAETIDVRLNPADNGGQN